MSSQSPEPTPAGWYPDPDGQPRWRLWNGSTWSNMTKPYGGPPPRTSPTVTTTEAAALQFLHRIGVPSFFVGLALALSTAANWPTGVDGTSVAWAVSAGTLSGALLLVAYGSLAVGVRTLQGYWSLDAWVPGLQLLSVNALLRRRLRPEAASFSPLVEAVALLGAIAGYRTFFIPYVVLLVLLQAYLVRLATIRSA